MAWYEWILTLLLLPLAILGAVSLVASLAMIFVVIPCWILHAAWKDVFRGRGWRRSVFRKAGA